MVALRIRWSRGVHRGTAALAAALVVVLLLSLSAASAAPVASGTSLPGEVVPSGLADGAVVTTSALQSLVNSAVAGATVHLPAGTFVGQLRVNKDLSLVGAGEGQTILRSPALMSPDPLGNVFVIEIGDHSTVQVSALTVQVTEQCMLANSIGVATGGGVGVHGNSTLQIWNVRVVAYGPAPDLDQTCTTQGNPGMLSFGRAISIGLDDGPGDGTFWQDEGHGLVTDVQTRGFDIFSISVGGVRGPSGSTATIADNTVRVGPGPYTAAYGIVVYGTSVVTGNLVTGIPGSDGGIAVVFTSAIVTGNTVRDFTCTNAPFPISPPCGVDPFYDDQDLGIFLASITPGTIVTHNSIENVDAGIFVDGPGAPALIEHNWIGGSTFYGLDLINANQTFRDDQVVGGMYAIAVGAANFNSTAVLAHDTLEGYSVALALLEANSPWVAKALVRAH